MSSSTAADQRRALAHALRELDPEAPTLCAGWNARDLAEHIVIRDSKPHLTVAERLPLLGRRAGEGLQQIREMSYSQLIDAVVEPSRRGPVALAPVDNLMNTMEFYIHTEDLLRAQPQWSAEQIRTVNTAVQRSLWNQGSRSFLAVAARKLRWRISYLSPGFGAVTRGGGNKPLKVISGPPGELLLWASGREEKAQVSINEADAITED